MTNITAGLLEELRHPVAAVEKLLGHGVHIGAELGKHCHVLETADKLPCKITALVKCPIHNNKKIPVEIGA